MTHLWCRLHNVWVDQLAEGLSSTMSVGNHWRFWRRAAVHSHEGLIQPKQQAIQMALNDKTLPLRPWFKASAIFLLVVVLVEVVPLVYHFPASEVQRDLPVFAGGMAKLSQLRFLFPQPFSLIWGQPLIGFSGKVIRLIIQNLRSPDTGVWGGGKERGKFYQFQACLLQ